jgi:hypothetical protein
LCRGFCYQHLWSINIKKLQSTLKKVVIGRAVTAPKQQKSKGKAKEKGIAEVVHLMKPITRSPDSSNSSSSNNNNNNNNKNHIITIIIIKRTKIYYFLVLPLLLQFPKGLKD